MLVLEYDFEYRYAQDGERRSHARFKPVLVINQNHPQLNHHRSFVRGPRLANLGAN